MLEMTVDDADIYVFSVAHSITPGESASVEGLSSCMLYGCTDVYADIRTVQP